MGHCFRRQRAQRDRPGDERGDAHVPLPGGPCGMVERDGTLWIESQRGLIAFDPAKGEVIDRIRVPGGIFSVTSTPSGCVGDRARGRRRMVPDRIWASDGSWARGRHRGGARGGLAVDGDQIWTVSGRGEAGADRPEEPAGSRRRSTGGPSSRKDAHDRRAFPLGPELLEGNVLRVDGRNGEGAEPLPVDGSLFGGSMIWKTSLRMRPPATTETWIHQLDTVSGEVRSTARPGRFRSHPRRRQPVDRGLPLRRTSYRLDETAD